MWSIIPWSAVATFMAFCSILLYRWKPFFYLCALSAGVFTGLVVALYSDTVSQVWWFLLALYMVVWPVWYIARRGRPWGVNWK